MEPVFTHLSPTFCHPCPPADVRGGCRLSRRALHVSGTIPRPCNPPASRVRGLSLRCQAGYDPRQDGATASSRRSHAPTTRPHPPSLRDAPAVAELFLGVFRRDLLALLPPAQFERPPPAPATWSSRTGPDFRLIEAGRRRGRDARRRSSCSASATGWPARDGAADSRPTTAGWSGRSARAAACAITTFPDHQLRPPGALPRRLGRPLRRGLRRALGLRPARPRPSRIAATIQTLRTAALSTYENHASPPAPCCSARATTESARPPTPADALPYGVELTGPEEHPPALRRRADAVPRRPRGAARGHRRRGAMGGRDAPRPRRTTSFCARTYVPHARATRAGGHVCVVLSPNQEIKLFAEGAQAFAFAHGRWRLLDPPAKFAVLVRGRGRPAAWPASLFGAALNLAEGRAAACSSWSTTPTRRRRPPDRPERPADRRVPAGDPPAELVPARPAGPPRPALPRPGPARRRPRPGRPGGPRQPRRRAGRRPLRPARSPSARSSATTPPTSPASPPPRAPGPPPPSSPAASARS